MGAESGVALIDAIFECGELKDYYLALQSRLTELEKT
jgi:hypothetical protein